MEILFELLFDFIVQVVGEVILGLLSEGIGHALHWKGKRNPVLAAFGCTIIGAATGAASLLIFPTPILRRRHFHGVSLIVAPLATGALMKFLGDQLRSRGRQTTSLMTFWGGSMFALTFAFVRFWWLYRV